MNRKNPLGTRGELTEEYAELIKALWLPNYRAISPRLFKNVLERHAPQFQGSEQHDCQVGEHWGVYLCLCVYCIYVLHIHYFEDEANLCSGFARNILTMYTVGALHVPSRRSP